MRLAILLSCLAVLSGETLTPQLRIGRAQELNKSGDLAGAEQILLEVVQDEKTPPEWLAVASSDLGVTYHVQGRTAESERWHLKARALATPGSLLYVQLLNNLASLYLESGQYGKGERIVNELTQLAPQEGEMALRTQGSIAALHMARGRNEKAEQMFLSLLSAWEKAGRRRDMAVALNNLGVLAMERKDKRTALSRLRRSYELWRQEMGGDDISFVYVIANYGSALLANGQSAAAEEHLARALSLAERSFGPDAVVTLHISSSYADALTATGRGKEAKSLREKAARSGSALRSHTVDILDLAAEGGKTL